MMNEVSKQYKAYAIIAKNEEGRMRVTVGVGPLSSYNYFIKDVGGRVFLSNMGLITKLKWL